jgi:signal transduction histidine kinase/CheY-like chemotaxis protein
MTPKAGYVRLYSASEWRTAALIFVGYLTVYELAALYVPAAVQLYPATAVAMAGLFFGGIRLWPFVFLAALVGGVLNGAAEPLLAVIPLAEALSAVIGAHLFRAARLDPLFRRYRDMFYLIAIAVIIAPIVPAVRGIAMLALGIPLSFTTFSEGYIAMVASLLIVTPFVLRWCAKVRFSRTPPEIVELLFIFMTLVIIDIALFIIGVTAVFHIPLVYILLIPFFWIALRMRPRFLTLALLITAVFALASAFMQSGEAAMAARLYNTEMFLIALSTVFFIVVSLEEDRRVNLNLMRSQLGALENAVARISSESSAKNDFIAVLAHELRNPLAPIVSAIELLKMKGIRDAEETALLDMMENRMDMVKRLLDDLLDISRISEGKVSLKREVMDLEETVRRAILTTDHYIKERHQSLVVKFPKRQKHVLGDTVRLEQVFSNLLTNASKYSNSGDTITLKMELADDVVEVSVTDEGIGINPKELDSIFTPFRQLEGSKKGLGIGLALVRGFVEMHGGTVEARSQGRGTGSTFIVRLPLHSTSDHPTTKMAKQEAKSAKRSGLHILVVDDNDAAAAGIGRLLELRGSRVSYAYDGRQALKRTAELSPDIVLLDVGLPDQDGYSVAKEMRIDGYSGKLIALTGFSTDEARERGKEAGFDHYLVKPAGLADLKRVIPELN